MTDFYHDTSRKLLVYRTPKAAVVQQYVPGARMFNAEHVAVPRTLHNLQMLRWLDLPVIPAMDDYDWPRAPGLTPTSAQKTMANFLVLHPRAFNLSDMGTMKTLAALWAADYIMRQYPKGECRALIVAPLSVLQRVWGDAIFKNFLGKRTFRILHGSAERRLEQLALPADFYVINFDGVGIGAKVRKRFELDGFSAGLQSRSDIRICIVDEASAYRDSRTKRHRIARMVLGQRPYLWLLTGTPTSNGPVDAYGLAKLVNNAFGESFTAYKQRVMMQVSTFKWIPRQGANEAARKLLSPAVRFDIREVWDGPPLTTQQREVELTPEQKKLMADLKRDLQVLVKSGPITAVNEASARMKFIQISLGAIYDGEHLAHMIDASPRLRECEEVIESSNRKILIFVPLTSIVNLLYRELGKKYSCGVLNGQVAPQDRANIIRAFGTSGSPRILIADPQTTAHGINEFVSADTVIWYGPSEKTELYLQGNKRAHRPGQNYPVTIVQMVSNPLEREIFRRLEANESLQGVLLNMVKEGRI